ncbi:hypothetical protein GCM10023108_54810 [Saccharopolyspora hordei]
MHRVQLADVGQRAGDRHDVGELADGPGVQRLGDQLRHPDQVVLVVLVRAQVVGAELGDHVPGRVVVEVVLLGGAHERGQVRGVGERVQVVLVPEERFPFLAVLAPAWRPQGDDVALRQPELDGDDVLRHLITSGHRTRPRGSLRGASSFSVFPAQLSPYRVRYAERSMDRTVTSSRHDRVEGTNPLG